MRSLRGDRNHGLSWACREQRERAEVWEVEDGGREGLELG